MSAISPAQQEKQTQQVSSALSVHNSASAYMHVGCSSAVWMWVALASE